MNNNYCVVTSINFPTKAIEVLHEKFGNKLIVVGDKKTPKDWNYKDVNYIPFVERENWFEGYDPTNHYARKNIGYLEAMRLGANVIHDCDDDSIPNENWKIRLQLVEATESISFGWCNVYRLFNDKYIWPRGFSLRHLNDYPTIGAEMFFKSSIQQGMVDADPDVDAIWRIVLKEEISFTNKCSVFLHKETWCPFNSQNTFWFPPSYALMYLPVYATFRMCDIWRSFVAQRILWEIGEGVTFHSPAEVYQDRNEHDLLKDFEDEIPGYLHNDEIVETLQNLELKKGEENICENMLTCYQALVDKNILPEMEIRCLKSWIKEYENIKRNLATVS